MQMRKMRLSRSRSLSSYASPLRVECHARKCIIKTHYFVRYYGNQIYELSGRSTVNILCNAAYPCSLQSSAFLQWKESRMLRWPVETLQQLVIHLVASGCPPWHLLSDFWSMDSGWLQSSVRRALSRQWKRQPPKARGHVRHVSATPHQVKSLPGLVLSPGAARQQHAHTSASDLAPLHQASHPVDQHSS